MKLRTYLILSYVALIVILSVGAWCIDDYVMADFNKSAIRIADRAVNQVTAAHVDHSDQILTRVEEFDPNDHVRHGYLVDGPVGDADGAFVEVGHDVIVDAPGADAQDDDERQIGQDQIRAQFHGHSGLFLT